MKQQDPETRFLNTLKQLGQDQVEAYLASVMRERNLFQFILNSLQEGVLVLTFEMEVVHLNDTAKELLNIVKSTRTIIGNPLRDCVKYQDFLALIDESVLKGTPLQDKEFLFPGKRSGNYVISSFISDFGENKKYIVLTFRDTTREKKLEEENRRIAQNKAMLVLSMGLAHEIRNPLNAMKLHAQVMLRDITGKTIEEISLKKIETSAEIINEEINRLSNILKEFDSAIRPTTPVAAQTQINNLAEHAYELMIPLAKSKGVELIHKFDYDIPLINIDSSQISMAIINLLKNAIESFDDHGNKDDDVAKIKKTVTLSTTLDGNALTITVTDNGCGMEPELAARVFEPFHTTKSKGTGLGMSIVSRIIREHNGKIVVQSVPHKGTSVKIVLPMDTDRIRLLGDQLNA